MIYVDTPLRGRDRTEPPSPALLVGMACYPMADERIHPTHTGWEWVAGIGRNCGPPWGSLARGRHDRWIVTRLAARENIQLDIKARPPGTKGFTPIRPLYKVEHAFARLGRWRRLSRCFEQTQMSAEAWLRVAAFGYLLGRV